MTKQSSFWIQAAAVFLLFGTALPINLKAQETEDPDDVQETAAQTPHPKLSDNQTEDQRNRETESVLDSMRMDFAFGDERPFREVLGEITSQSGLKFSIDQTAEDCDLSRDTAVSFSAESMRLRTGLQMMLERYNGTFVIRDGMIVIISNEAASDPHYFRSKLFDVENLLQLIIRTQEFKDQVYHVPVELVLPPEEGERGEEEALGGGNAERKAAGGLFALPLRQETVEASGLTQDGGLAAGGASKPVALPGEKVAGGDQAAAEKTVEERVAEVSNDKSKEVQSNLLPIGRTARVQAGEMLIKLIDSHVSPREWVSSGAGDGTIAVVGGVLVVTQSEDILHQVGRVLSELERKLEAIDKRSQKK